MLSFRQVQKRGSRIEFDQSRWPPCVAFSLVLPVIDLGGPLVVGHLVVLGAVGFGTFTVSLIALGEVLTGIELVAANAAFGLLWGLGDFAGALTTGWLMDLIGTPAFALSLAAGFLLQCLASLTLPLRVSASAPKTPKPPS